ncbi:sugar ABC transporter permease [Streptomyces tubbatahanensis]|uniref:Sugar ABC transporter permease n=1 Tax=Streptomyces tubbatahanensis TaxID=2923272 RepID=A0ABY3XM95_9ACTN|nr:sugar ABC transporter permease [Streptomyces tubbatahanensis]UNS95519.1 sugar ABC transporter permease [Streptomyces tubbatahanensis]
MGTSTSSASPVSSPEPPAGTPDPSARPLSAPEASRRARTRRWLASWRRRDTRAAYAFISPWMVGFLALTAGPMAASFVLSFTNYDGIGATRSVGLENYRQLFEDPQVATSMANTLLFALMRVPLSMALALALALLLLRVGRAAGFFRTVFYLPVMTPSVAVGILFLLLFNGNVGLINTALGWVGVDGPSWTTDGAWVKPGLVLTTLWALGSTVVIYLAALRAVPQDLYEAAELDGAGRWQSFRHVTLPQISGAVFFTLVVNTIAALQTFDEAYTAFFGTSNAQTYSHEAALFYVVYLFQQAFQFMHMGYASAMSWLLFVIILVITVLQARLSRRFVYYEGETR